MNETKTRFGITLKVLGHNDWKTASVFPERWPLIEGGSKVEIISEWSNFYGRQLRIKGPNGEKYDVDPLNVKEIRGEGGVP